MGTPAANPEAYRHGSIVAQANKFPDDPNRLFIFHGLQVRDGRVRVRVYVVARLRGCVVARLRGCVVAWLRGCVVAWLHGGRPVGRSGGYLVNNPTPLPQQRHNSSKTNLWSSVCAACVPC